MEKQRMTLTLADKIFLRRIIFLVGSIVIAVVAALIFQKPQNEESSTMPVEAAQTNVIVEATPIPLLAKRLSASVIEPPEPLLYEKAIVQEVDAVDIEPEVDARSLELLALVIYQEAGGDYCDDDARRMVADVVLNRVEDDRFPNTIEEVLLQEGQYGRLHWTGLVWADRAALDEESEAVDRAYRIAEEVLTGQHSALYGNDYIWQAEFEQGTEIVECCDIYFGK